VRKDRPKPGPAPEKSWVAVEDDGDGVVKTMIAVRPMKQCPIRQLRVWTLRIELRMIL
jgi:hypothetical protein